MKGAIFIASFLLISLTSFSQEKKSYTTTIQANAGIFRFIKMESLIPEPMIGIKLLHGLNKRVSVGASYQRWYHNRESTYLSSKHYGGLANWVGQLTLRGPAQYVDLLARYQCHLKRKRVYGELGLSRTWGEEIFISAAYKVPGYDDVVTRTRYQNSVYYGALATVGYDHLYYNKHINFGLSGTFRYYGSTYKQYEVCMNIGYNFNLFKTKSKIE